MYERVGENQFARLGSSEKDNQISKWDPVTLVEATTFRFLVSTLIWLDITSSITTGTKPSLSSHHHHIINPESHIKLDKIMGCEGWVMSIIGRISTLHESKLKAQETQDNVICSEFEQALHDIRNEILPFLAQPVPSNNQFSGFQPADATTFLTHGFASMALVYLHLITYGFQHMELVPSSACASGIILHGQIPTNVGPSLICPLFIIGVASKEEDKEFFQTFFSSPVILNPAMQHRRRILPVLEEIWRRRAASAILTWHECTGLTSGLLLI